MKQILLLMCIIFPIQGIAQIDMRMDYDNTSKKITLSLKNETKKIFSFIPKEGISDYEYVSSISFVYKDKEGNVLCSRERLIYDDQYHQQIRKGQFLAPYETNCYFHLLTNWCQDENIHTVDITVKIDARIAGREENGKIVDADGTYKTEFKKSILYAQEPELLP